MEAPIRHLAPPNWDTLCGLSALTPGLLAYDTVSYDPDDSGWCPECVAALNAGPKHFELTHATIDADHRVQLVGVDAAGNTVQLPKSAPFRKLG